MQVLGRANEDLSWSEVSVLLCVTVLLLCMLQEWVVAGARQGQ